LKIGPVYGEVKKAQCERIAFIYITFHAERIVCYENFSCNVMIVA